MRQKCWQPIETLWKMQQNMCCDQDNYDISSVPECLSEYRIIPTRSPALTISWAHQESASEYTCTIIGACLQLFSIVYQIKLEIFL